MWTYFNITLMKPIELREADFKKEVDRLPYPSDMKTEFFEYWTEPNKSNTKMRFEQEKTWHLDRRMRRWANNGFNKKSTTIVKMDQKPKVEPVTQIEKLDAMLNAYKAKFEAFKLEEFAVWYEYLKAEKLLRTFTKEDVEMIRNAYGNDNKKCRAAAVKMTFDSYINSDLTFGHIIGIRRKLA